MQRIKTKVWATAALFALVLMSANQSKAEEKVKHRSIVDYWKNLYVRLDAAKRYNSKVTGFARHPKTANVIGAGIGYQFFNWPVRMEVDVHRNNFNVTDDPNNWLKAKTQTSMLNVYRDFTLPEAIRKKAPFTEKVIPYVTGGIGRAKYGSITGVGLYHNTPINYSYAGKTRIAWNLGLGATVCLDHVFSVDVGFRYLDMSNITFGPSANIRNAKTEAYQGNISILMNFW